MKSMRRVMIASMLVFNLVCTFAADRPARFEKPEDVVAWLYRDFGWECFFSRPFAEDALIDQPRAVLERYFDAKLSDLIIRDRAYVERTKEVGHIDFVLLFGSQDPEGVGDLRIERLAGMNKVNVVYDQNGESDIMEMQFDMLKTSNGWRISDILYDLRKSGVGSGIKFSLRELLSQPE
jgi:hypothetical protein